MLCISCGKIFETEKKDDNLCIECLEYFAKEDEEYRKMKAEIEKLFNTDLFEGCSFE